MRTSKAFLNMAGDCEEVWAVQKELKRPKTLQGEDCTQDVTEQCDERVELNEATGCSEPRTWLPPKDWAIC